MPQPNVVYIHSHDTGRYIQPYGHAIPTPNLQKFAESGTLFRQAFTVNPTCSPSRSALLTGMYPHVNGMFGLAHRGFRLKDYSKTMPNTLRQAGYHTVLTGVQHIAKGDPNLIEKAGYAEVHPDARKAHESAVAFLKQAPKQPFFLDCGFIETHREFPALQDAADSPDYCLPPAPLPDTPETRVDMARYKASARILDAKIGQVLDALDAQGLASNTLVIVTTDHGIAFPRMKCNLQDSGTGIMLMMRGKGLEGGRKAVDGMVSHMDLFPAVCEAAGIERPAWLQGASLLPLARGEKDEIHEQLFFEVNYHAAYEPMRAVRTKRWKYIRQMADRGRPVMSNCDNGESKSEWVRAQWPERPVPPEELYDLAYDPNEGGNLAAEARVKDVLAEMRARVHAWMVETRDPMLTGPAPAPAGAVVNDPGNLSPGEKPRTVEDLYGAAYVQHEY
ncbi:MAG: sulfatase [Planctomycetota bacterium]|nr:sulfatase [Planctomycetota bacterium]